MIGLLRLSSLASTGSGVRVAVVDSGVHAAHPHVHGVAGGIGIDATGAEHSDYIDRLGHGTAVCAAIREKVPSVEIYAVKVFDRELATTGEALVSAFRWAAAQRVHMINLSLGTTNAAHENALADAVSLAIHADIAIVAAAPQPEARWLPGALPGVIRVDIDWTLGRDVARVAIEGDEIRIAASGYPRPIHGVPPERNLKGLSFAVANATGILAGVMERRGMPHRDLRATICGVLETETGITPSP